MITVKVSELLAKVQEIAAQGFEFVEISEIEGDEFDGETLPKSLNFTAIGDYNLVDFEEIDEANTGF